MEVARLESVAVLAFVLVLCITSSSITWHCLNDVARLQSRVERLEAEYKSNGISQLLGKLGVQTPVYEGDDAEEDTPGHQGEVRQTHHPLHDYTQQMVQSQMEKYLGGVTNEDATLIRTDSLRSKRSALSLREWNPTKGQKGEPGPPGPSGDRGPVGRKGIMGEQGVPGERGEKGDMGTIGEKGERGDTGLTGPAGVSGSDGQKGDMGAQGPVGEKGERGDTGLMGAKGQTGEPGLKGSSGEKGQKGERGEKGEAGEQGLPGEPGPGKGDTSLGHYVCGGTTGWARVAYLDMTNSNHQCPGDMVEKTLSGKRVCGRSQPVLDSCASAIFSTSGLQYTHVCGKIRGYQVGGTDGFRARPTQLSIESRYVDGVSVTHGPPGSREHVWTLATGLSEGYPGGEAHICPCAPNPDLSHIAIPSFVGQDYFCESGNTGPGYPPAHLLSDDPLWDGEGCTVAGNTCCQFNNPPYFTKHLSNSTHTDLEVRVCGYYHSNEDTLVELIELYISSSE